MAVLPTEALIAALDDYLSAPQARRMQDAVRAWRPSGSAAAQADSLTARLQAASGDRHVVLRHDPALARRLSEARSAASEEEAAWTEGLVDLGIGRVAPGLLELTALAPAAVAGAQVSAALREACRSSAVCLDLRENPGGYSDMVQLIAGWFLPHQALYTRITRGGSDTAWTRRPDGGGFRGPLAVLIGPRTFSAAEALAACLGATGRARLFGEATGGGGNTGGLVCIGGGWLVRVPTGRVVIAASGQGWEGTGVQPHRHSRDAEAAARLWMDSLSPDPGSARCPPEATQEVP